MTNISRLTAKSADWRGNLTWYTRETLFLRLLKFAGGLALAPLVSVECTGAENIPASGGCILASNHVSNFDVPYLVLYTPRHLFFMAKIELYKNPIFAWVIRQSGSFPIHRGENDPWAMKQAGHVLAAGQILAMFPEGHRSGPKAQLQRGKVGAVKLALEYQAPLIPAAIIGTQNIRLGWKTAKVTIRFGQPLDLVALAGPPPYQPETLRELTTLMMQQIAALLPPEHRGVYA